MRPTVKPAKPLAAAPSGRERVSACPTSHTIDQALQAASVPALIAAREERQRNQAAMLKRLAKEKEADAAMPNAAELTAAREALRSLGFHAHEVKKLMTVPFAEGATAEAIVLAFLKRANSRKN